ncbi:MAG: hypothetical protein KKC46_14620 [Proteobacteria bacterium]|nr:hypothetical protein [Pseudomonadota bacterium]
MKIGKDRLTFAKIGNQEHPLVSKFFLNVENEEGVVRDFENERIKPDDEDLGIADEILSHFSKYSSIGGPSDEWSWIDENCRKEYISALLNEDRYQLALMLRNMFRNSSTFGITSAHIESLSLKDKRKELLNTILLDIDTWKEFTNNNELAALDWTNFFGNPCGLEVNGVLISADTLRHDYFAKKISGLLETFREHTHYSIIEVGGGVWRACHAIDKEPQK